MNGRPRSRARGRRDPGVGMRAWGVLWVLAFAGCDSCSRALPIPEETARDLAGADLAAADLADPASVDFASACSGFDEKTCRAHKECVADFCFECSCTPTFVACRAPSAPKTGCPGLGCDQPVCCTSLNDCNRNGQLTMTCVAPGEWPGCGVCTADPPCQSDSDCPLDGGNSFTPTGPVCDDARAYRICGPCFPHKICILGCTADRDCVGGRICDASHHCVWKPCATSADCAANFECTGGSCSRTSCSSDADCPVGFCVQSSCYEGEGTCQPAPI